jgi:Ala-tRNA(Pro) deacylase
VVPMVAVEAFLQKHNIKYIPHHHPAVFTCEEASKFCMDIPGIHSKNLFLWDKKDRYFLVILSEEKKLSFSAFAKVASVKKVCFANEELLKRKLDVPAGSVSLFSILNDLDQTVELYIDQEVYSAEIVSFHPNINTITLELSHEMLQKFLEVLNRPVHVIQI